MTALLDPPAVVAPVRETDPVTGNRWYEYPPTGEQLTSVTTFLSGTQGKPWIPPWAAKLAAEYAIDNIDVLRALLKSDGRDAAVKLAKEQAKIIRDRKADAGSHVHHVIEALILWAASPGRTGSDINLPVLPDHLAGVDYDDEPIEDVIDFMVSGFINFVADFQPEFEAAEMTVYNQPLGYAGTLDMIIGLLGYGINRAGDLLIPEPGRYLTGCVDAKTGRHPDVTYREQIAGYRRATECLLPLGEVVPMPATDFGAVLHLRPEYERGYRLLLVARDKDQRAWERFVQAVDIFLGRESERDKPGKVVYPLRPDGTMPSPLIRDMDGEGYGIAPSALFKAGIRDLEQLAAMDAGDLLATKGVGKATLANARRMLADHGLHLRGESPTPQEVPA